MDIRNRIELLEKIYSLFDDYAQTRDLACKRGCATCCTGNMTLTTLEGFTIISRLDASQKAACLAQIKSAAAQKRYQPRISTNQMAQKCIDGEDIPEENIDPAWGDCPLLDDRQCPVYMLRPFGCRCMMSRRDCARSGYADIDEFTLTVANLFNQFIEHLDTGGLSGNLIDVLLFLDDPENLKAYQTGQNSLSTPGLILNHPIPVLMIPPEHRKRIGPLLESLTQLFHEISG